MQSYVAQHLYAEFLGSCFRFWSLTPLLKLAAFLFLCTAYGNAFAQAYPARSIRMVIPFPPGGGTDLVGRVVAQKLSQAFGQQVVVDNRGGASGQIATELVAKAPSDGYTTLVATVSTFAILPSVAARLPFDVNKDFSPIVLLGSGPNLLVVHPSVPARNVRELIALAKARPGQLQYASPGAGTSNHLAAEFFKLQTKVDILHVSYKGSGQAVLDLIAGQVHMNFDSVPAVNNYVRQGKLRAIAVTSTKRFSLLPDIPTMEESGVPGFDLTTWWGLVAPAGVSSDIISRIHGETSKVLRQPDVKEKLAFVGAEPAASTSEGFAAFIRSEREKYSRIVKAAKIQIE